MSCSWSKVSTENLSNVIPAMPSSTWRNCNRESYEYVIGRKPAFGAVSFFTLQNLTEKTLVMSSVRTGHTQSLYFMKRLM
ncbi:hypothetical protein C4D60_Mb09t05070 [Musa balbisiana]|uniref:Uncharacterized protein n=1 Tax=Musa balbisiana TaxID=52838 RepID=A0A4S8IE67_MUSBA|nr:hypothetical protein C4D60_Mb09t05070 [Musa balbisiana]